MQKRELTRSVSFWQQAFTCVTECAFKTTFRQLSGVESNHLRVVQGASAASKKFGKFARRCAVPQLEEQMLITRIRCLEILFINCTGLRVEKERSQIPVLT